MNKKGFTLIELITTFALASVIIVILVNIVVIVKNIYSNDDLKTKLLINQSSLSQALNSKLNNDSIDSYINCSNTEFCFKFNLVDGSQIELKITDNIIKFGDYVYKLEDGVIVDNPSITKKTISSTNINIDNSFLIINIPIKSKLYKNEDFGINLIYTYNSNKITL